MNVPADEQSSAMDQTTKQNTTQNRNHNVKIGPNGIVATDDDDENEDDAPLILSTQRPSYNHEQFDQHYVYERPPKSPWKTLRRTVRRGWRTSRSLCSLSYFLHWLMLEHLPMIDWIRHYSVRTMLTKDVLAGITCGIMQVPQGMAYGFLSSAGPVAGLYTAFVPPIVYSAFASSRHVSVASFAVLSMLTASVIGPNTEKVKSLLMQRSLNGDSLVLPGTAFIGANLTIVNESEFHQFAVMRTATAICLAVGLFLLTLGVLRLGFISCYLSDSLIAGFCAGAAVHIFTTQLFPALGLQSNNPSGWMMLYRVRITCQTVSRNKLQIDRKFCF